MLRGFSSLRKEQHGMLQILVSRSYSGFKTI